MKRARQKRWILGGLLAAVAVIATGCRTLSYYGQAIRGQYQILASQKSVEKILADTNTGPRLREQLELIREMRHFAAKELGLPVNGHYAKYADLHRKYVVWNVQAAPEFSLEPKTWWYPVVGRLEYRGYFSEARARDYAEALERKGYDVYIGNVGAYSTLGFFKDPILNTFAFDPEPYLAETLFHELAHQEVFAKSDTDFNEAFATAVGEEGARRWLAARSPALAAEYELQLKRTREWVALVMQTREALAKLYGDVKDETGAYVASETPSPRSPGQLAAEKELIIQEMKKQFAALRNAWGGATDYDAWFDRDINNAQLNSIAAYYELVPGFEELLRRNGGDLAKFYVEVDRLARMPQEERHDWVRVFAGLGARSSSPQPAPYTAAD